MKTKLLTITAALALSINAFAQIPTNGLVAYYPFTGNANDFSGNNLNGTVQGAVLTTDRFGSANSAYNFNGTTDNISINTNSLLDFQTVNKFSISYWIKPTSLSVSQTNVAISKQTGSGSSQDGWNSVVDLDASSNMRIQNGTSTSACTWGTNPSTIAINQYYHIVQIYDNGTSYIYKNGVLANQVSCVALIGDNTSIMLIGKATWTSGNAKGFNGIIDDIAIYNRALTSTEVTQIFTGTCTPDITTGLVAQYNFSGNANDLSGNNNNGTVNGATLTTDRFGNANSAYSFDGNTNQIILPSSELANVTALSLSGWFNANPSQTGFSDIFQIDVNNPNIGNPANDMFLRYNNGLTNFTGALGIQGSLSSINTTSPSTGTWHHFALTYNGLIMILYIDGVFINQGNASGTFQSFSEPLYVGNWNGVEGFNGKIDDIRIYNRALTSCDVDSLYNEPNPCTGITASVTAGGSLSFCQGGNVVLTASSANSYLWSNSATTQSITVNTAGNYSVTCTNFGGCSLTSAATTVIVNALPAVTANATANSICTGSSVTLTGGGASTYTWTGGITNGTAFSPTSTATYTVTGADGNGCTNTATKTIIVNSLPVVSINTVPAFININASPIAMTGSPAGGTFTGNGVNSNNFTPLTAGLGTSQITYNYTNSNNCSNSSVTSTIVYDTTGVLCTSFDTVYTSVADTLIINAVLTGVLPPNNMNAVIIYPNPASTHITIDNGNYNSMAGYTLKIENNLGQTVFTSLINQQQFYIDLSTWSGNGIYFVHIIDTQSNTIEIKKIILQ